MKTQSHICTAYYTYNIILINKNIASDGYKKKQTRKKTKEATIRDWYAAVTTSKLSRTWQTEITPKAHPKLDLCLKHLLKQSN